jgi:hypothetical protein
LTTISNFIGSRYGSRLRIEHDCGPLEPRRELRERLKPLASHRGLGASGEVALSSCQVYSRSRIARRSYWRRPEVTERCLSGRVRRRAEGHALAQLFLRLGRRGREWRSGTLRLHHGGRPTIRCFLRSRACRAPRKVLGRQILRLGLRQRTHRAMYGHLAKSFATSRARKPRKQVDLKLKVGRDANRECTSAPALKHIVKPVVPPRGQSSSRVRRQLHSFQNRGIIVLRLVDPRRDGPHPHPIGRERPHQVGGVRLVAKPSAEVLRR